jgi:hypothetical protein
MSLDSHGVALKGPVYPQILDRIAAQSGKLLKRAWTLFSTPSIYIESFIDIVQHRHFDPPIHRPSFVSLYNFLNTLFSSSTYSFAYQTLIRLTSHVRIYELLLISIRYPI